MGERDDEAAEGEDQWRFSLEDIEEREAAAAEGTAAEGTAEEGTDDDSGGNIAGTLTPRGDIEPGDIDLQNALFVALGVVATLLFVAGFYVALL